MEGCGTMKTLPKSCETCLYMATHEKCDKCLHADGEPLGEPFQYHNYQEGNWMKRVMLAEIDGKRNIVIGGQGEAEVNTKWTPEKTVKHLRYVSEQCGYITSGLSVFARKTSTPEKMLTICTNEGRFLLVWLADKLDRIIEQDYDGNKTGEFWSRESNYSLAMAMAD